MSGGKADSEKRGETSYENRDERAALEADFDALAVEPVSRPVDAISTVVSVRLRPDELALVETAARKAGLPLSSFIRAAAVGTANPMDFRAASARAESIASEAEELATLLRRGVA